ncbi:hypothetical protein B0H15DRAFT_955018 [Mycena belliarum]|uniref:Uncharacterized protein n=1 Tax=Mycena belliarum TaxID=1033014 RepID=A0AAD6TW67_9AGAR|nr:hypothetical protein B0H15DRAFT_955018 [Mycena belliae]
MSILAPVVFLLAPAPEPAALPANADEQDILAQSTRSRAKNEGFRVLIPSDAPRPAPRPETHAPPPGVSGHNVLGSTAGGAQDRDCRSVDPSCLSCPPGYPLKPELTSACRLANSRGPCEKEVFPACCLPGRGATVELVAVTGAGLVFFSPAHGPWTEVGSIGWPSVIRRSSPSGPASLAAASFKGSLLCLFLVLVYLVSARAWLSAKVAGHPPLPGTDFLPGSDHRLLSAATTVFACSGVDSARIGLENLPHLGLAVSCSPVGILGVIATDYARTVSNIGGNGTASATGPPRRSNRVAAANTVRNGAHGDGDDPSSRPGTNQHRGRAQAGTRNRSSRAADVVKIMYWNIFHDFTLKLTSPDFHDILCEHDIMFFAETDMLPGEDEAAEVPLGYTLVSLPRTPRMDGSRRGGGVALLIRDSFTFKKIWVLSGSLARTFLP